MINKLFEVMYYKKSGSYITTLEPVDKGWNRVLLKVDTGAVVTSITLGALFNLNELTEDEQNLLKDQILLLDYPQIPLRSASDNEMIGILCHVKNVIVAEQKFNDFYFYLIPMFHEKALLGADFISCCEFVHKKNNRYPSAPTMFFQKFDD